MDKNGKTIVSKGRAIGANKMNALKGLPKNTMIPVQPFVATGDDDVIYLSADQEEDFYVAQANADLDHLNQFVQDRVELRVGEEYTQEAADLIDYMDVSPMQIMSVSAAVSYTHLTLPTILLV